MSGGDDNSMEDQIVSRFLNKIENHSEISEEITDVIEELSDEDDFGGRDRLAEGAWEVKEIDAD